MSRHRFLLDENIDLHALTALREAAPALEVSRVGQQGAPPLGSADQDLLVWCESRGFSLVTRNRASMPVHLHAHLSAGRHVPGIFVVRRRGTLGIIIEGLLLLFGASEAEEYRDQIVHLPLN